MAPIGFPGSFRALDGPGAMGRVGAIERGELGMAAIAFRGTLEGFEFAAKVAGSAGPVQLGPFGPLPPFDVRAQLFAIEASRLVDARVGMTLGGRGGLRLGLPIRSSAVRLFQERVGPLSPAARAGRGVEGGRRLAVLSGGGLLEAVAGFLRLRAARGLGGLVLAFARLEGGAAGRELSGVVAFEPVEFGAASRDLNLQLRAARGCGLPALGYAGFQFRSPARNKRLEFPPLGLQLRAALRDMRLELGASGGKIRLPPLPQGQQFGVTTGGLRFEFRALPVEILVPSLAGNRNGDRTPDAILLLRPLLLKRVHDHRRCAHHPDHRDHGSLEQHRLSL
jgi:hypothetical protein